MAGSHKMCYETNYSKYRSIALTCTFVQSATLCSVDLVPCHRAGPSSTHITTTDICKINKSLILRRATNNLNKSHSIFTVAVRWDTCEIFAWYFYTVHCLHYSSVSTVSVNKYAKFLLNSQYCIVKYCEFRDSCLQLLVKFL
jgi:hypothetical protein